MIIVIVMDDSDKAMSGMYPLGTVRLPEQCVDKDSVAEFVELAWEQWYGELEGKPAEFIDWLVENKGCQKVDDVGVFAVSQ